MFPDDRQVPDSSFTFDSIKQKDWVSRIIIRPLKKRSSSLEWMGNTPIPQDIPGCL
jgi:hypothetical protein